MASPAQTMAIGRATATAAVLDEVELLRSTLGGYMVMYYGTLVGWLQNDGERWRAYAPAHPPAAGEALGAFERRNHAIYRILSAAGISPAVV